jgi:hypothetical protein
MPLLGIGVTVEVQKTLGSPITLTAITKANPGVATSVAHGLLDGDVVVLDLAGMSQIDGQAVRVANKTADTFELEGIDTTLFGTFTSGTATEITAWDTFGLSQELNVDEQTPDEIDVTTLLDTEKKIEYGLLSAVKGRIGSLFEATDVALVNLRDASKAKAARAWRITFADSSKAIFNSKVAIGDAFQMAQGQAGKTGVSFTLVGRQMMFYAS